MSYSNGLKTALLKWSQGQAGDHSEPYGQARVERKKKKTSDHEGARSEPQLWSRQQKHDLHPILDKRGQTEMAPIA